MSKPEPFEPVRAKRIIKKKRRKQPPPSGIRLRIRESGIHGRGAYAAGGIKKGTRVIEYTGQRRSWEEASAQEPHDLQNPHHTFLFGLDNGVEVIDANIGGNEARWINHSCDPNCEAREKKGRVFIYALRDLGPGDELFYDYSLVTDERRTRKLEKEFACHCGSSLCRGTMLEPK